SGGDAVAGQNYVELSGSVTILAGQTSADISVEPIADWKSKDDKTLSISLIETDSYLVDSGSSSSQITIQNLNIPYSYPTNVWIGDGDAAYSNAWHLGHMPTSEETVLLADIYSSGDITWNCNGGANGLTNTVNEWLQTTNYTGSVIIPTTYEFNSTTFTNFIVLSDMVIAGGKVQCPYNNPTDDIGGNAYYILKLKVEGDLIIKDLGSINVYARGYEGSGPGKFWLGGIDRAAYGGSSGQAWNNSEFGTNTYGSILKPWALGSAGQDYNSFGNGGGGAVWLEVAGNTQVDAEILANGFDTQWGGGTGGSIYLKTATLSGTGTIMSNGGNGINSINQIGSAGGGGRVSVNLTDGSNTGSVVITAYGNGVEDKYKTGAGTVFVKTVDNLGLIKVDNNNISAYDETLTHIPAFRANAGYNNVPMITKDTPEELEGMDVSVTRRARVHFTEDLNLNTVDVDTSAVVYLDGHTITVQSFTDGDTVYASAGEYTADELNRFLDPDGTGKIVIEAVGTVLILQ
ncbi:MAG: hypothetical protein PF692_03450, partial [Kiritimatiellae bacterium]|nr:hypothetical protein [Kiritimatiellia bacterium]